MKTEDLLASQLDFMNSPEAIASNKLCPTAPVDDAITLLSIVVDKLDKPPTRGHRKQLVTISKSLTACPYLTTRFLVLQWSMSAPHFMAKPDKANLAAKHHFEASTLKLELAKHPILK